MKGKTPYVVVLVVAIAALGASIAYALDRGSGAMHRSGYSMMAGASGQRSSWYLDGSGSVRDIAAAREQAQRFADRLGLKTGEVMQFADNFYVRLDDRQGRPATEVLVDPASGRVTLEYGAAMMWNTRYGMMGGNGGGMMQGAMGRYGGGMMSGSRGGGPVDAAGARAAADRWLAARGLGAKAGEAEAFPGYFTMETLRDGRIDGMVSVNARTGAVLYHWWHGRFVASEG